jgi:hypothetical protein
VVFAGFRFVNPTLEGMGVSDVDGAVSEMVETAPPVAAP